MEFPAFSTVGSQGKKIDVQFTGGKLTSNAGVILLQEVDQRLQLTERVNEIIFDPRNPIFITHEQRDLLAQRIYSIALGYEDVNDQDSLRTDPALLGSIKNLTDQDQPLGSSPTISRLENRITADEIVQINKFFVKLFIESYATPPKRIELDVDATDDPIHGNQVGSFFNKFYDHYCFLPLYFFCGGQLLWAQLRTCKTGGAHGTRAILKRITDIIREAWPDVEIVLRGDAGFYTPELLDYCEKHGIYVVYCARGDMENRIKEQQQMLFADRTSCHEFLANYFRLLLSSLAYVLLETIRRIGLTGTKLENAQCSTIREKLLKIAAVVKESIRRIWFELPSVFLLQELWLLVASRLSGRPCFDSS